MQSTEQQKQTYIDQHIDDPDLCDAFPGYKERMHELERQFIAGKLRSPHKPESAPAEEGTTDSEDAAAPADQPEPGPDGDADAAQTDDDQDGE